jgi:predicted nuclease of restriction endonuclease-like (RecB) superfamily
VLDFLQLQDSYSEKDLEAAILREIEAFILELGVGFTFVARQKRITVDNEDYYIDGSRWITGCWPKRAT